MMSSRTSAQEAMASPPSSASRSRLNSPASCLWSASISACPVSRVSSHAIQSMAHCSGSCRRPARAPVYRHILPVSRSRASESGNCTAHSAREYNAKTNFSHAFGMNLITWNIQSCRGCDGRVDPKLIGDVCGGMADFDVLCFQEVARNYAELPGSSGEDQFALLGGLLPGFTLVDGIATDVLGTGGKRRQFGNLILTRY